MRSLLPLIGATVLMAGGAFCAWQAWLIADEGDAADRTHAAQRVAVQALSDAYAGKRNQLLRAVADPSVATVIDDHAGAAARLRVLVPAASEIEVYSAGMDEVVRANYREFGYAKAAQLMAALGSTDAPLASSTRSAADRRLSVVEPVNTGGAVRAWVWVEYPFD
ncbi:MAG: phosphomannomutase/phosphoglucomutase, partial [Luteibacter sp.]